MTMLLASVKNLSEVRKILTTNFDIIDLKNPSDGVLGAWNLQEASKAVKLIAGKELINSISFFLNQFKISSNV